MKQLFLIIKAHLNTKMPEFKTVAMFNDQIDKSNIERTEKAFRMPACFVQFVTSEIRTRSLGVSDVVLQVIFHLVYEGYKYSETRQLADMDLTSNFDFYMQGFRGDENDTVQFTSMQRIIANESEDFDNVNKPIMTYMTMWRCLGSYKTLTPLSGWNYELNGVLYEKEPQDYGKDYG